MPLKDSVGPSSIALGGVVVNDVEDDLDAGIVEARHHFLEFGEGEVGHDGIARDRARRTQSCCSPSNS